MLTTATSIKNVRSPLARHAPLLDGSYGSAVADFQGTVSTATGNQTWNQPVTHGTTLAIDSSFRPDTTVGVAAFQTSTVLLLCAVRYEELNRDRQDKSG